MNYWDFRKKASKIIPRIAKFSIKKDIYKQKEKGRKSNYKQFNIIEGKLNKIERLLDKENIGSFAEVSLRAQSCPMPLNVDVWDGIRCPYACKYCYADYFKHSLYTSFFDNAKTVGLRYCNPNKYKKELDELFKYRGKKELEQDELKNAVRLEIPMRLGIRFEDFPPVEKEKGISYILLKYLSDNNYPVMINTKSDMLKEEKYLKVLSENKAGAAVHITLISSNESFLKKIEPGAPSFQKRIKAASALSAAGIRVVARIEPWMMFLNDEKDKVDEYIYEIKKAGIKHMTFDSYSYSANSKGIAENFYKIGIDFRRMFLLSSDSQWMSSLFLGLFMDYFRENKLKVSTFDQGNVPSNDDWICCSIGDYFSNFGFNWGSGVIAIKFVKSRDDKLTRWGDFVKFVEEKGGFLSEKLKKEVHILWNGIGDAAWPIYWGRGLEAVGNDNEGIIWKYNPDEDFRLKLWSEGGLF